MASRNNKRISTVDHLHAPRSELEYGIMYRPVINCLPMNGLSSVRSSGTENFPWYEMLLVLNISDKTFNILYIVEIKDN